MTLVLSEKMNAFLAPLKAPQNPLQQAAFDQLKEMDFPTTREEYWKYTRLGKIANGSFQQNAGSTANFDLNDYLVSDQYIVIENGTVREDLSAYSATELTVTIGSGEQLDAYPHLAETLNNTDVFNVMNTALTAQTIHISAVRNQQVEKPLQLVFVGNGDNSLACNRIYIEAGTSAAATVVLTTISADENTQFNNTIVAAHVGENAQLNIHKIQASNNKNLSVCTEQIVQEANSTFKLNTITLNGLLQRNNINIAVKGTNCETHMNGAVITKGKQHVDNHTFVDHQVSNCFSNENYKYVLDGHSTGVFNGRVVVQPDAQVINAYQNNGNILLSDTASINSKPELEIYADDVKCSHGSTTGQLDEDALFYLQARGIAKDNARKLLVSAFVGEVVEALENDAVIANINALLKKEHGWDF